MKSIMPAVKLLPILPEALQDEIKGLVPNIEEAELLRKSVSRDLMQFEEGERAAIQIISSRDIDRDGDIIDPDGAVLTEFERNPVVLLSHDYSQPAIGSAAWVKSDGERLIAKTIFADTERGEEIWRLVKGRHMSTTSIGFIPVEWTVNGGPGWAETTKRLSRKWGVDSDYFKAADRIFTKVILLEYSQVTVPAQPNALTVAVAKSLGISDEMIKRLGVQEDECPESPVPELRVVKMLSPEIEVKQVSPLEAPILRLVKRPVNMDAILQEALARAKGRI